MNVAYLGGLRIPQPPSKGSFGKSRLSGIWRMLGYGDLIFALSELHGVSVQKCSRARPYVIKPAIVRDASGTKYSEGDLDSTANHGQKWLNRIRKGFV